MNADYIYPILIYLFLVRLEFNFPNWVHLLAQPDLNDQHECLSLLFDKGNGGKNSFESSDRTLK